MRIGLDSRSVTRPSRSTPPSSSTAPTSSAGTPPRAMARRSSPSARGTTAAAMIGASEESGPSTRTRDGPVSAYTSSGTTVAYSPACGGRPAACAYPMPAGISRAVTTTPAVRSSRSHARR